jgi:hypothetical protein
MQISKSRTAKSCSANEKLMTGRDSGAREVARENLDFMDAPPLIHRPDPKIPLLQFKYGAIGGRGR